jgi:hypothetical protein
MMIEAAVLKEGSTYDEASRAASYEEARQRRGLAILGKQSAT